MIRLVTQRPKAVASQGKQSKIIVDLRLNKSDYWPTILYNTLQYLTIPIIPTLPYIRIIVNKLNNVIRLVTQRLEAVASQAKQSEIVDLQLTNQIADLHYPTIPYNTFNTYNSIIKVNLLCTLAQLKSKVEERQHSGDHLVVSNQDNDTTDTTILYLCEVNVLQ